MRQQIICSGSAAQILLVEDNPGDVRLLTELFSEAQITNPIHVAVDGEEALDFVRGRGDFADSQRPDIVLLDWNLPRVGGEQILREIDRRPELDHLFTVILTGSSIYPDSFVSSDLSADGVLTKPVDPDELCSLVCSSENFTLTPADSSPNRR